MLWYDEASLDAVASDFGERARAFMHRNNGFLDRKPRCYINYGHGDESLEELYGHDEWRLQRLKTLKKKYDPTGVFSAYHPIPTA
jgi:FAD/FMN-containing dehydrogenase